MGVTCAVTVDSAATTAWRAISVVRLCQRRESAGSGEKTADARDAVGLAGFQHRAGQQLQLHPGALACAVTLAMVASGPVKETWAPRLGAVDAGHEFEFELIPARPGDEQAIHIGVALDAQTARQLRRQQGEFAVEERGGHLGFGGGFGGDLDGEARFVVGDGGVVTQLAEDHGGGGRRRGRGRGGRCFGGEGDEREG